eukprot:CAMPEP_0195530846 /NCGR_PEP_ID=MMETSP0794_2-20130614/33931_1 /TAXON_ID=515487 /ORGANISM="Stephanopyxis turris, Strain CCMP 815" /LENGTH=338 /DNA_ID=CAMNT_0040662445 /DNA_START=51 /DNA_END=1067 /DNA_ORIENTATION=+
MSGYRRIVSSVLAVLTIFPNHCCAFIVSAAKPNLIRSTFVSSCSEGAIGGGRSIGLFCAEDMTTRTPPPKSISAPPGKSSIEEQPIRNPIDKSSVILIIGGTRGIGLEFVKQCARKGATVIATHRQKDIPFALLSLMKKDTNVQSLEMEVGDEASVLKAAEEYKSRSGFEPLTHIIHSAGLYPSGSSFDGTARGGRAPVKQVTKADMMEAFSVNTIGPLLVAQAFVPLLTQTKGKQMPVLAFLTSKVGSVDDNQSGGAYAYRASKSALNILSKSLSIDLADQARVVLLHPGYVRTDMTNGNGLIDVHESVNGMLRAIEATDATVGFRWVDYKASLIPW